MNEGSCGCTLRCCDKVSLEQRKKLFSGFWGIGEFDVQNAYINGCVKSMPVKRHYSSTARRGTTRLYYVQNGEYSVRVCKVAFLKIHGISNGRLCRVITAAAELGGVPRMDTRGHHEPSNKTSQEEMDFIHAHIESFPHYTSHYSRNDNPNRTYLSPALSLSKMHVLYKERCTEDGKRPVSDWVYRKVFNEQHNLSFGR